MLSLVPGHVLPEDSAHLGQVSCGSVSSVRGVFAQIKTASLLFFSPVDCSHPAREALAKRRSVPWSGRRDSNRIASRESASICLPNPLLSCSSLTGPDRLKCLHDLSLNSKPVSANDKRTIAVRQAETLSETKEEVPLAHRWPFASHACLSRSIFPAVASLWLGSQQGGSGGTSPSPFVGPLLPCSWSHWECQCRYCLTGAMPRYPITSRNPCGSPPACR
jgi:hypothetical protein